MCDVCKDESGEPDVGVAAVPGAPVSLMWCKGCLLANAVPRFVVEVWAFSEFTEWDDDGTEIQLPMPAEPPDFPLAPWAGAMTIWMGKERGYLPVKDLWPELWRDELERRN